MKNNNFYISPARKKYLKTRKLNKFFIRISQISLLIIFIFLWEILVKTGIIDGFMFSSPSRILKTLKLLLGGGELWIHIATTLSETLLGFFIATIAGTLIAILLWLNEKLLKILEPYIVVLNALPKIALGPVIIIAFGSGFKSIVFMTVFVTIIVTIINMLNGFMLTDKGKILLLKSMNSSKLQILWYLVLPSSAPTLISTLKVNVGLSWIGSIMGEYIVSKQGLGYLIVYGGQVLKLDLVMTSTFLLCILAALMYGGIVLSEKLLKKRRQIS